MEHADVLGLALMDYLENGFSEDIRTTSSLEETDVLPLAHLFRGYAAMPELEQKALQQCTGSVLDIGCGAGSHSLWLQEQGLKVTAIDISPGAIHCAKQRGVNNVIVSDFLDHQGSYDTLLLLMNGIGLAGALAGLGPMLHKLKSLLAPGGQILVDSSDIIYMFEDEKGEYWVDPNGYYGEVQFQMHYKKFSSPRFPWLYVDYNTLTRACLAHGLQCEMIAEGAHYDYLARIHTINP
ncbi:class I SAM-dependent methyltransferase [Sediminicola luteus]|uniref:SAM-dependent methyltransferase n=1 Tax=Sediminicola luteus TaxID=319238 RepID=A0A2A4G759_9FLAO|nr:class I SAM-dependent methyltransferase [Sediminicola luteus]PCE64477.1 SAM-dependent methyltransferase [Sediminicola luteus]